MGLGNYVCAYPNTLGAGAVFPLTPVRARVALTEKLFATTFGLPLRGKQVKRGDTFTLRFLAASASTTLEEGNQVHDAIRRTLGIGCEPSYDIEVKRGKVTDTTGRLLAAAENGAFAAKLSQTKMSTDLFVQVQGLTDGWTAAKQINGGRPQAVTLHDGTAHTNVDLNSTDARVVCGHPVTCSNREVRLVAWWNEEGLQVYVQNPTKSPVECRLQPNGIFEGLPSDAKTTALEAGGQANVRW